MMTKHHLPQFTSFKSGLQGPGCCFSALRCFSSCRVALSGEDVFAEGTKTQNMKHLPAGRHSSELHPVCRTTSQPAVVLFLDVARCAPLCGDYTPSE